MFYVTRYITNEKKSVNDYNSNKQKYKNYKIQIHKKIP